MPWIKTELGTLLNTDHLSSIQKIDAKGMLSALVPELADIAFTDNDIEALKKHFGLDLEGVPPSACVPAILQHILKSTFGYKGEIRDWIVTGGDAAGTTKLNIIASFGTEQEATAYVSKMYEFLEPGGLAE